MIRRVVYLLAALGVAAMAMLTGAPAALAHATLESTSPADGAVVAKAPTAVTATFDEAVGVSPDSLRVYAPNGSRADNGQTTHGRLPQEITVGLLPGLGPGTYTVGWHVISADSHPVQGAFTFSVGAPSNSVVTPASLQPPTSKLVTFMFGVVRWVGFGCFALLIGAIAFTLCCWPAGAARPELLRLAMAAWGGLAAATLAAILMQGIYGAGQSFSHLFWPNVLHATLHSSYGRALAARLVLVVVALIVFSLMLGALPSAGRRARRVATVTWAAVALGLASTWSVADHSGTGMQVPIAIPSDMLHLTAMAVWLGGLVTLVAIVLRRPVTDATRRSERRRYQYATAEAAQAVSTFSPIALGCVATLVVTGSYQAWRGVGTWNALFDTTYGRLLLIKIGGMCALIALGNLARQRVHRLRTPVATIAALHTTSPVKEAQAELVTARAGARGRGHQSPRTRNGNAAHTAHTAHGSAAHGNGNGHANANGNGNPNGNPDGNGAGLDDEGQVSADQARVTLSRLRWSVSVEVIIVIAVLAVTAILVNTPTGRETYHPLGSGSVAFNTGGPRGSGRVSVIVSPARLGPNQLRLTVTNAEGQPYSPQQIEAVVALPARNLGPLPVTLTRQKTGTYVSAPVVLTITGQWQIELTVRSDAFDETTVTIPISVS